MKRIFPLILLFIASVSYAQNVDIIYARNGDIYEGYVSYQSPGEKLTIVSNITTLTVSHFDIEIGKQYHSALYTHPDYVLDYFPGSAPEDQVALYNVVITGRVGEKLYLKDCLIRENGNDVVVTSFYPHSFDLGWSEIKTAAKVPYSFDVDYGIVDRLISPDAKVHEGQMMEQNILTGRVKFRDRSGQVTNFIKSSVYSIRHDPVNSNVSIWQQTPYCDKINKKDGSVVNGFIVSKRFGENVSVQIFNTDGIMDIPLDDIDSYGKYPNPLYVKDNGSNVRLFIDGTPSVTYNMISEGKNTYVMCPLDSINVIVPVGKHVKVKYFAQSRTSRVCFARSKSQKETIYSLRGIRFKKKGMERWPVFTSGDKLTDVDVNYISNDGRYIVADMVFDAPGLYVVFLKGSDECICLNVIKG